MTKPELSDILQDLLEKGYFKEWRNTSDVIEKLSHRGFTVDGKTKGVIGRMLTQICQDSDNNLERRPVESGKGQEKWKYKEFSDAQGA